MSRQLAWCLKIGLMCASFLVMEGLARVYVSMIASPILRKKFSVFEDLPDNERRVSPHPYLCYSNTPSYRHDLKSHNRLGWRGAEITLEKPKGVLRIAILGGSTTYTEAVSDDAQTFPAQLERLLNEVATPQRIEVINAGVPGYNSAESLINLCFRVIEMDPDMIVIHHGANDVHCRMVKPESYRADNRGRRKHWQFQKMSLVERHSALYRILSRVQKASHVGLEPFVDAADYVGPYSVFADTGKVFHELLDKNPPTHYRNNLRHMLAIAKEHDIKVLLTTWAWCGEFDGDYSSFDFYQRGFKELNAIVTTLAADKGVPCYDFARDMAMNRKYWHDGRHVNAEGALLKAELFAKFFEEQGLLDKLPKTL